MLSFNIESGVGRELLTDVWGVCAPSSPNNYDDNGFFEDEDPVRADKKNSDVETSSKPNKHQKPQSSIPLQHNNPPSNSEDTAPIPSKHAKPRL